MFNEFVTDADIVQKFGISKHTLAGYRSKGKIPYFKIGGKVAYKEADVLEFIEKSRIDKIH